MRKLITLTALAVWPLAAQADVTISDGWARASVLASRPAAAYITLQSEEEDQLIGVTTPIAGHVTIHAVDTDANGVSRMIAIDALNLPSNEQVKLAPGGMHLMLMSLTQKLEEGTVLPLTLTFASGAEIEISVPVLGPGASGPEKE